MVISRSLRRGLRSLRQDDLRLFLRRLVRFGGRLARYLHGRASPLLPRGLRARDAAFGPEYRFVADPLFRLGRADLTASARAQAGPMPDPIRTATWFLPSFHHVAYGGLLTVFRFVDGLAERGVASRVVVYDDPLFNADRARESVASHFPRLADMEILALDPGAGGTARLPACDIAFCTLWPSAYVLARFNQTARKYYFVQDFEPSFHEAGSRYALAESTYRFGFPAVVNTPGLLAALEQRYGMAGVSFVPAVDRRYYFPPERAGAPPPGRLDEPGRLRVFFYCRPQSRRNAFELGLLTIRELLDRHGSAIEVLTAGEVWDEADYGMAGRLTNLGLLATPREVADLYRSCDIGFCYMLSKHPSYQPLEFMACGMAVVTNRNEDNAWLLRDGINCLLAEPNPLAMAEAVSRLVEDPGLRRTLQAGGAGSVAADWDDQIEAVWRALVADDW